jgi:hypothetical protein
LKKQKETQQALKNVPPQFDSPFATEWINKMVMGLQGPGQFYSFKPADYAAELDAIAQKPQFTTAVHLVFNRELEVAELADLFGEYGDYYIAMDTKQSCFLEFLWIDTNAVNDRHGFIKSVLARPEFGVIQAVLYENAPHFQSHSQFKR